MTGMRYMEYLVKTAQQFNVILINRMGEYSKTFFRQSHFTNTKMMIQPCLCRPTDMHGRGHIILAPFKNLF
ncbi:hypothetical protein D3C75_538220 [compost metagenome]